MSPTNGQFQPGAVHSTAAEENVLGSILADPLQYQQAAGMLSESDFLRPDHRLIWRTICALQAGGKATDVLTVREYLERGGELEDAGGFPYLGKLARETALPSHCAEYARIVRSHSQRREMGKVAEHLLNAEGAPAEEIGRAIEHLRQLQAVGASAPSESLELLRGCDVKMEATDWLWHEWLAAGCLQVFAGPAGLGKTSISLSLAATVTTGRLWPDGSRCQAPGSVIFWSGEDAVDKTLMPRFRAMGGDPEHIYFVDAVATQADGSRQTREFDPSKDIPLLIAKAHEIGDVRLLVVDPVSMCVAGDSNKNAEVRRGLAPLKEFAERHGAAVLGVSHFSKGSEGRDPLSRVTGSLAFGAAPRLVLSAVTETPKPDEPEDAEPRHLFVRTKSNLGPCGDGFRYTIEQAMVLGDITASRIVWGEHLKGAARDLLAVAEKTPEDSDERSERAEAMEFLRETLGNGATVAAKQLLRDARDAGHSERTIRRAAQDLGVQKAKQGMGGGWIWKLPAKMANHRPEDDQTQNRGHLREAWPPSDRINGLEPSKMAPASEDAEDGHVRGVRNGAGIVGQDREAF